MRMADAIDGMPPSCLLKNGLRNKLEDVAMLVLKCFDDRWDGMLASPIATAKRVKVFVIKGPPLNATHDLMGRIERTQSEIDDGMHGISKDPNFMIRFNIVHRSRGWLRSCIARGPPGRRTLMCPTPSATTNTSPPVILYG